MVDREHAKDHWDRKMARMQEKMERFRARMERVRSRGDWFGPTSSGNRAFDDYRAETLKRLEDEQLEFKDFLARLRFAKDRAEFDQFMAERRQRPSSRIRRPAHRRISRATDVSCAPAIPFVRPPARTAPSQRGGPSRLRRPHARSGFRDGEMQPGGSEFPARCFRLQNSLIRPETGGKFPVMEAANSLFRWEPRVATGGLRADSSVK